MAYTITCTLTGSTPDALDFHYASFTGATVIGVEGFNGTHYINGASTTPTSGSFATSTGSVAFGATQSAQNPSGVTAGSGFTLINTDDVTRYNDEYQIMGSGGTVNPGFTYANARPCWVAGASANKSSGTFSFSHKAGTVVNALTASLTPTAPSAGDLIFAVISMNFTSAGVTQPTRAVADGGVNTWVEIANYYDNANNSPGSGSIGISIWCNFGVAVLPTVTTQGASAILPTSVVGNGTITATGGVNSSAEGFVYDTVSHGAPGNVTPGSSGYANFVTQSGSFGVGPFTEAISGLTATTTYYYRAWSQNTVGYAYGGEVSFATTTPVSLSNLSFKFNGLAW